MSAQQVPATDQPCSDTHRTVVGGGPLDPDQLGFDIQTSHVGVDPSPATDQRVSDSQSTPVGGGVLDPDHAANDAQLGSVGVDPSPPEPNGLATSNETAVPVVPLDPDQMVDDTHGNIVGVDPSPADAMLAVFADALDDLEATRIANQNRARALEQVKGMAGTREHATIVGLVDGIATLEHQAELGLARTLRKHPFGPWVKTTKGIGEKQGARLIAAIGDPYWHPGTRHADGTWKREPGPRLISELIAYCGYDVRTNQERDDSHPVDVGAAPSGNDHLDGDTHPLSVVAGSSSNPNHGNSEPQNPLVGVAPTRKRGQRANWNATARMRARLCAEAAVKAGIRTNGTDDTDGYNPDSRTAISPYGQAYLDGRRKYADAIHKGECRQCGPKGKPAQPGSELSEGHKHARALRLVAKQILKDLFREAQRIREVA